MDIIVEMPQSIESIVVEEPQSVEAISVGVAPPSSGTGYFELFTLSETDISNKYVEIQGVISDNQNILVFVDNVGIKAEQGVDYSISGNQIFWNNYDFQNLLETGDKLKIFYT